MFKSRLLKYATSIQVCHICGQPATGTCEICDKPMCDDCSNYNSGYDEGFPSGPGEVTYCADCEGENPYAGPCKSYKDGHKCSRAAGHRGHHRTLDGKIQWRDDDEVPVTAGKNDDWTSRDCRCDEGGNCPIPSHKKKKERSSKEGAGDDLRTMMEKRSFSQDYVDGNLEVYSRDAGGTLITIMVNSQSQKWVAYANGKQFKDGKHFGQLQGILGTYGD